jgi:hypothetical protein
MTWMERLLVIAIVTVLVLLIAPMVPYERPKTTKLFVDSPAVLHPVCFRRLDEQATGLQVPRMHGQVLPLLYLPRTGMQRPKLQTQTLTLIFIRAEHEPTYSDRHPATF